MTDFEETGGQQGISQLVRPDEGEDDEELEEEDEEEEEDDQDSGTESNDGKIYSDDGLKGFNEGN